MINMDEAFMRADSGPEMCVAAGLHTHKGCTYSVLLYAVLHPMLCRVVCPVLCPVMYPVLGPSTLPLAKTPQHSTPATVPCAAALCCTLEW